MAAVSSIKLTFNFADETKRNLVLEPFDPTSLDNDDIRTNVMTFNSTELPNVANLLLSDDGASCTGITAALIDTVNKREINLND